MQVIREYYATDGTAMVVYTTGPGHSDIMPKKYFKNKQINNNLKPKKK